LRRGLQIFRRFAADGGFLSEVCLRGLVPHLEKREMWSTPRIGLCCPG
jgi:hypothetical protein